MKKKNIIILAICIIIILSIIGFTYGRFTYESETIGSVTTTSRNPFEIGTLAYNIVNNAMHTKDKESTIYSEEPLTTPAKEINGENERTLSVTEDDYGISYYYRGNVKDNYIDFNGMCFRIVRIEGDGSIKLILEDKTTTCKNAIGGENSFIGTGQYGYKTTTLNGVENVIVGDYENCEKDSDTCMKKQFDNWFNASNFDKRLLKEETWNLGDLNTFYSWSNQQIVEFSNNLQVLFNTGGKLREKLPMSLTKSAKESTIKDYIATLSAEELAYSGAKWNESNTNYYLYNKTHDWLLLSLQKIVDNQIHPFFVSSEINENADWWKFVGKGSIIELTCTKSLYLRPSIVLNSGIKIIGGDGTEENAYKINENPFDEGTLAYSIVDNAINPKEETSTIYSPSPKTIPAQEVSKEDERTLSITKDDYGRSYYYRGNIKDNYIDFNGMCWRIVRIEGDGSIKLILEDKTSTCKDATPSVTNSSIERITSFGYKEENGIKVADYENCASDTEKCIKNKLEKWFEENFKATKDKLKYETWQLGDQTTKYKDNGVEDSSGTYYEVAARLNTKNPNKYATLVSNTKNNKTYTSYVSTLTADEAVFAGAAFIEQAHTSYYLWVDNLFWWTLSLYYQSNNALDWAIYVRDSTKNNFNSILAAKAVDNSQSYDMEIRPSIVLNKDIEIIGGDGTKDNAYKVDENPFDEGTLAYSIVNNAINPKGETSTIYSPVPKTIPAKEVSGENERTLSVTEDTLGRSYYFRGNVNDNYLTFNNMCWRIVRIEGDGSIKLILEDKTKTCKDATGGENPTIEEATYGYKIEEEAKKFDYINCTSDSNTCMRTVLQEWFRTKFTNDDTPIISPSNKQPTLKEEYKDKLKYETWYVGDTETFYNNKGEVDTNLSTTQYSNAWKRLAGLNEEKHTSLLDNKNSFQDYVAPLIADEVALAGAVNYNVTNSTNTNYYLFTNQASWWLLSPAYTGSWAGFTVGNVHGWLSNYNVINSLPIRPSIVLNKDIKITSGDGTKDNAYIIE